MLPTSPPFWITLCVLGAFAGSAAAAPTDSVQSEDAAAIAGDAAGAKPAERIATPDLSSGSRTVDMLIELQGKQAGLGFSPAERSATRPEGAAPRSDPVGRLPEPAGLAVQRAGLFGNASLPGATPSVTSPGAPRGVEWRAGPAETGAATATPLAGPRTREASQADDDGRISLPRAVVTWIRENRGLVIGASLVVLVAVGAASRGMAQRRR